MPILSRRTERLLKTVSGKTPTDRSNASSSSSSPSSVPKPAPMLDGVSIDADPVSSDSERSSPGKAAPTPPSAKPQNTSPHAMSIGQTPAKGQQGGNGRGNSKRTRGNVAGTQDSGIGLSDSGARTGENEEMGLFEELGGPAKKHRKVTSYVAGPRSFTQGGARGTKSANSTPKKLQTKKSSTALSRANSTGKAAAANKKGMPLSNITVNSSTPTLSSERLSGEFGDLGVEGEEQLGKKLLKRLGTVASLPGSPREERKLMSLRTTELSFSKARPQLKTLERSDPSSARPDEDKPRIRTLSILGAALPQKRKPKQIKTPARIDPFPSPEDSTLEYTHQESNDYEIVDLSTGTGDVRLSKRNSGHRKTKTTEAPSKMPTARKLKTLGAIHASSSNSNSKFSGGQRRSTRRGGKNQDSTTTTKTPSPSGSDNDNDDSDLSSPPDTIILDDEELELNGSVHAGNYEQPAKCPICRTPVDRLLLEEWQGGQPYMRINKQMAFCEAHKRASAREEYAAREYPASIDFEALPARIERFREDLVRIVRRERPSAFRNAVEREAARGLGRNLVATSARDEGLVGMSVGYYGPRGRRIMEGWVTRELAGEIAAVAGGDRLIGFKSVSGFIQEVLVPEVAMRLVAEDLDVGEARAREVLRESGEIGEFVHGVEDEEEEGFGEGGDAMEEDDNGDY